ncbi:MAG TPA: hypothetical protein VMW07_04805 [Gallionella sp.]|nr:hypothetical protein [Gallionella sp.]
MSDISAPSLESQALLAIHEEALKLLAKTLPPDVEHAVALIESICRFRHDVRTEEEKKPAV